MLLSNTTLPQTGDGFHEHDERIKYFIKFDKKQNFGDYLPELFCKSMLTTPRVDVDIYRLVGSVIDEDWIRRDLIRARGNLDGTIAFWGCGLRAPKPLSVLVREKCIFYGVRGPLSRETLGLPDNTVLGDPGLLCPLVHPPNIGAGSSNRSLCIPHVHDSRSLADLHAQSGCDDILSPVIDASETALRGIIDRIIASNFVLAGSLHSAIIAFAYNRPFAFWDTGHIDIPFKWEDFALSVGLQTIFVKNLNEGLAFFSDHTITSKRPLPLAPILANAPFHPRPEVLVKALEFDGFISSSVADSISEPLRNLPNSDLEVLRATLAISRNSRKSRQRLVRQIQGAAVLSGISIKRSLRSQLDRLLTRD